MLNVAINGLGRIGRATLKIVPAPPYILDARNNQIIQTAFDAWRNGTGGVFDLLAPNAEWAIVGNSPVSRTLTSRQEFLDVTLIHSMHASPVV
jgi:hypothetical protein